MLGARGGRTVLRNLAQQGSAKVFLPRAHQPEPEVVFLNTAGGLTGGDQLRFALEMQDGSRAVATTQTAERAYASLGGNAAKLDISISVGACGDLAWLPQETILFDQSALHRRTQIDLAEGATLLTCEMVVLGRAAMQETVTRLNFRDWRDIRRGGRPVVLEPLALNDQHLAQDGAVMLDGARVFGTMIYLAPDAEDRLAPLRAMLEAQGVTAAASAWDGKLIIRALAADAWPLKVLFARLIEYLRAAPLPRVWQV
ncbi:MAG: urease accessory protein UreD [Mangrovicoccus sp.]